MMIDRFSVQAQAEDLNSLGLGKPKFSPALVRLLLNPLTIKAERLIFT
jgi:hypothetical protein